MNVIKPTLKQEVALVTGGAKRIGRAISLALASEGWDIVVHYNNSRNEAQGVVADIIKLGRRALALQCDLTNENATRNLFARAMKLGHITCLVNNASLFEYDEAHSFSMAVLDAHMHINVVAPLLLAQSLYAITPKNAHAVIINLLDQKLYNLNPDFLSYTLSKATLSTATTLLAQAFAPRLRVVGIAPGITTVSGNQSNAEFELAHQIAPLGKSSTLDDISAAVCYIASARAITGTTLLIDGGQHLISQKRDIMFITK